MNVTVKRQRQWKNAMFALIVCLVALEVSRPLIFGRNSKETQEVDVYSATRKLPPKNRTIVFVHVGKTGGIAIKQNVAAQCEAIFPETGLKGKAKRQQQKRRDECVAFNFRPHEKLASQTLYAIHLWDTKPAVVAKHATSFLFSLRNPVDRAISSYRYAHPENCQNQTTGMTNYGCWALKRGWATPGSTYHRMWRICFPNPAMEDFAQSLFDPWTPPSYYQTLSKEDILQCRKAARKVLQGAPNFRVDPHMQYNYQYYVQHTIQKFPDKEVLVVRTEHQYDDLVRLDYALGGTGQFRLPHQQFTHGSEHFHPSPLTPRAYHNLCCLLEHEIQIYRDLMEKAINLNPKECREADRSLRSKCGLSKRQSWEIWTAECRNKLNESLQDELPVL